MTDGTPAAQATATWEDLLVRNTTSDTGQIPAQGGLNESPDIIPQGREPLANPAKLIEDMSSQPAQNVYSGESNYLYARGVNNAKTEQTGKVHLYYSRASLLMYPRQWKPNELKTSDGTLGSPVSAKAGADFVTNDPFYWEDVTPPPESDHYCLVSQVSTGAHPDPIPDVFQIPDFAKFISENRGFAWRNISVVADPGAPTFEEHIYYEQGETEEEVHFLVECTNVAPGCSVAFNCGTPGPNPAIDLAKTEVTKSTETIGIVTTIPAGFVSNIALLYWSNGVQQPANAKFVLRAIYVPPSSAEGWEGLGVDPAELGIPPENLREREGPVTAVPLGSFGVHFKP